jgi:hypothetical protein
MPPVYSKPVGEAPQFVVTQAGVRRRPYSVKACCGVNELMTNSLRSGDIPQRRSKTRRGVVGICLEYVFAINLPGLKFAGDLQNQSGVNGHHETVSN